MIELRPVNRQNIVSATAAAALLKMHLHKIKEKQNDLSVMKINKEWH